MVDNIKKVSNPLTIIAIFAALAEINSTVAIGLVTAELQEIFIWFIIAFPSLLIIFFFLTLNFNPKVIYAPSDFQNEENFLNTVSGGIYKNIKYDISSDDKNVVTFSEAIVEPINSAEHEINISSREKRLTDKANTFIRFFSREISTLFEGNKLKGMSYGIKGEGLFLLTINANKELFPPSVVTEFSMIIKLNEEASGAITLEAIDYGLTIKETDISKFSGQLKRWLEDRLTYMLASKNAPPNGF